MRATQATTYRTLQYQIQQISSRLLDMRNIATTGKRVNRPSDDPTAIKPILNARSRIRANDRFMNTTDLGLDKLQTADGFLEHVENILINAKEKAIQGSNATMNAEDMNILADSIKHIKDELLQTANAQVEGKYLFAGFMENTRPFTENPAYDPLTYDPADRTTWPVLYNGDANATTLEFAPGETIAVSATGNALFVGDADNDGAVDAGGTDIFAVLTQIEAAMRANDPAAVGALLGNLDQASDQIYRQRAGLGNNAAQLDNARSLMADVQIDLQQILSRYEDADIIKAITDISQQETALQAALSITAKVSQLSILNYL
ncbi:MAG: flagellar hook-associated protein 3 [Deltaproteobacteria bacterium RIFOXYD12_FULL_57_12]|nr:MAG: flagellar hook-associated protein 3 [Deltaproteobacteria bacterium RIFOXYD12_FULL_57_12]